MNTDSVMAEIEAAVGAQLELAGDDPAVEVAASALLTALRPALRAAATELAEQAGAEVAAQLPGHEVAVILLDGEPTLQVRPDAPTSTFSTEDLEARLTLRLPPTLKTDLEDAAGDAGDSVNAYVIKALSGRSRSKRYRKHTSGTLET